MSIVDYKSLCRATSPMGCCALVFLSYSWIPPHCWMLTLSQHLLSGPGPKSLLQPMDLYSEIFTMSFFNRSCCGNWRMTVIYLSFLYICLPKLVVIYVIFVLHTIANVYIWCTVKDKWLTLKKIHFPPQFIKVTCMEWCKFSRWCNLGVFFLLTLYPCRWKSKYYLVEKFNLRRGLWEVFLKQQALITSFNLASCYSLFFFFMLLQFCFFIWHIYLDEVLRCISPVNQNMPWTISTATHDDNKATCCDPNTN